MFRVKRREWLTLCKRYCTKTKRKERNERGYSETILMPKTDFPVSPRNVSERDKLLQKEAGFLEYYDWQRKNMTGKEFVLHDGPPYANGNPHIGHALNKILKDIILRSKLIQGSKVHYVPGWDCHGLPIELVALKNCDSNLDPVEIREQCKRLAESSIEIQREAFKSWGVLGNWEKGCYYTYMPEYINNELLIFWELYEKGFIYHGLKPVYWSPSSRTALAEAELIYNPEHVSNALTLRLEVVGESDSEPTYLLVWTTTPWTLPLNKCVNYSKDLEYSLVKVSSLPGKYVIASGLISENQEKLKKEFSVLRKVSHEELSSMKYRHPWNKNDVMSLFVSPHVTQLATGLSHASPSNGHEDFILGLKHGLPVECFVDENGCYTEDLGPELAGLEVLGEGSARVTEHLGPDVVLSESYKHSYPYDWRTHRPVIIRASKQWFVDVGKLTTIADERFPEFSGALEKVRKRLEGRPDWCLSRQRFWGVPIPAFFDKATGKPLLSKELTQHLCGVFRKSGVDAWWMEDVGTLFPVKFCEDFGVEMRNVERGKDIMDIWFDSGISWSSALDGKVADVCVEGVDQFGGWFQKLLLTSLAVRRELPYKSVLFHGFVVDETGKKMSKSLGNVLDPAKVTSGDEALGVDALRWWVGSHNYKSDVPGSMRLLEESEREIRKIRTSARFLLGSLTHLPAEDVKNAALACHLDGYLLNLCHEFYRSVARDYEEYNFRGVVARILHFITNSVSGLYIHSVKDRLYCDEIDSARRKSCVRTLAMILDTLCYCMAPILPHLTEEIYMCNPLHSGKSFFYNSQIWTPPSEWRDASFGNAIDLALEMKRVVQTSHPDLKKFDRYVCLIEAEDNEFNVLKALQNGKEDSWDSELTEILQVASVELRPGSRNVKLKESPRGKCPRCRRYTAIGTDLCQRCKTVMRNAYG